MLNLTETLMVLMIVSTDCVHLVIIVWDVK